MNLCINCGIAMNRCHAVGRRSLDDDAILAIVREWIAPRIVHSNDLVCQACWNVANSELNEENRPEVSSLGHRRVCILCGRSLLRRIRCHQLCTSSEQERRIRDVIKEWILPRTVGASSVVCHSCWQRAKTASRHFHSGPSTSAASSASSTINEPVSSVEDHNWQEPLQITHQAQQDERVDSTGPAATIILPNYLRPRATERRCFIEGCQRRERNIVPLNKRQFLLKMYNYYVPPNNRLCDFHLSCTSWDFLNGITENVNNTFTANQIQDMLALKDVESKLLDFENIQSIDDHMFYHWIGFNKDQFEQILNMLPQLLMHKRGSTALAAYLIKLRTGDSDERLSSLLKIPKSTLSTLINKARNNVMDNFVPHHMGINSITKEQIIQRNLIIPNGLFGNFNGDIKPIIILDGTYIYVQKSSNYSYQKKTYSLHKYQNLVKPFLMVCTDGYIIEVLGPYPATTSDAEIMKNEFKDNSPLREYFQPGDAFILDRGFRDALPYLSDYGYRTYVPGSLQTGETQLSTLTANKSRAVTICRWVVEVVNGRFKRDFKLLRQEYFNTASKSLMTDFVVAAALINAFHPPITNRDDAQEILQKINEYMYVENRLSDYIISNNINRRRAEYQPIDVDRNNVREFPEISFNQLILISLGTYQLKQARSYYGEHIRANGRYIIEVCREVDSDLLQDLSLSDATWLLRGRIQSRHISAKTYFVYVLIDGAKSGRDAIVQYYCNCVVGKRTVGCCAHTMSIIWYLGWARYQENIVPPAKSLDCLLINYEDDTD